jgi:hypothetical protein
MRGAGMLKNFLEFARTYKELVLLIVGIVAGIFFIRDYFATKDDVKILFAFQKHFSSVRGREQYSGKRVFRGAETGGWLRIGRKTGRKECALSTSSRHKKDRSRYAVSG